MTERLDGSSAEDNAQAKADADAILAAGASAKSVNYVELAALRSEVSQLRAAVSRLLQLELPARAVATANLDAEYTKTLASPGCFPRNCYRGTSGASADAGLT